MKSKKALSQVDWAISLGIFILYLAWFFILIKPQFEVSETPVNLLEITKENLLTQLKWSVEKRPLFVFSNMTSNNEGIIVGFPYELTDFAFSDQKYFTLDEGRLFFLDKLTEKTRLFWIINSSKSYALPTATKEITTSKSYTTTKDFRADFDSGLLNEINYKNKTMLTNFEIYINDVPLDTLNSSFIKSSILGGYKINTNNIKQKCYVLAENTKLYCFIDLGKEQPHDMTIKADLSGFTNYYANNLYAGSLSDLTCENFTEDYIDFYNGDEGLSFIFDKNINITICYNDGVKLNTVVDLDKNFSYMIVAHNGSYINSLNYKMPYYAHDWGIKQKVTGIDFDKMEELRNLSYFELKQLLGYPNARELIIVMSNSTEKIFRYNESEPRLQDNVFAQTFEEECLDDYSNKNKCEINLQTW